MFDRMMGMGFDYGGILKDEYEFYRSWLIWALASALGLGPGDLFWLCNKNETTLIKRNQKR